MKFGNHRLSNQCLNNNSKINYPQVKSNKDYLNDIDLNYIYSICQIIHYTHHNYLVINASIIDSSSSIKCPLTIGEITDPSEEESLFILPLVDGYCHIFDNYLLNYPF